MTGGLFNAGLMAQWSFTVQPEGARTGAEARIKGGDAQCAAIRAIQPANSAYEEVRQHPALRRMVACACFGHNGRPGDSADVDYPWIGRTNGFDRTVPASGYLSF